MTPSFFSLAFRAANFVLTFMAITFSSTFRAVSQRSKPFFHFGVQSDIIIFFVWRSKSLFIFRLAFKAGISFSSIFRATSSVWHSEPHFHFDIQSHIFFQSDVQSHVFISTSRAITFPIWCLEPLFIFNLAFRATPLFWRLEPYLQFGVQSRIVILAFKAESLVWCTESLLVFSSISRAIFHLAFRAIDHSQFGVQSHFSISTSRAIAFSVWRLELLIIFHLVFRATCSF